MKALYFGCARGVWGHLDAGHYWWDPDGHNVCRGDEATPFGYVDGELSPREGDSRRAPECPQGVAALHYKDGWTALSFWDRTGDSRGNSSSTFLFDAVLTFDGALAAAQEAFPSLFERFDFTIRRPAGGQDNG